MISQMSAYSLIEERANAISHGVGAVLSVVALILLLTFSVSTSNTIGSNSDQVMRIISFSIYGTSLILLFLASTFYHALMNENLKKLFKLLDHCAIYLLIAGTYTPLLLLTVKGSLGYGMLALIWSVAVAGIVFKIKCGHKYEKISLTTYLGMGFISLGIIGKLYDNLPSEALIFFASGGLVYCLGVIFYVKNKIPFNHAIWHLFVLGGATCHFFMIYLYV